MPLLRRFSSLRTCLRKMSVDAVVFTNAYVLAFVARLEQIGGEYLYLAPISHTKQLENRHQSIQMRIDQPTYAAEDIPETIQESIRFLISHLNEKQRRLYLGLESMKLGHRGDVRISRISGVNVKTIARGRRELVSKKVTIERIRRIGAGRPPLKKNRSDQDIK